MPEPALLVTGTDTGVGKTVVAAAVAACAVARGRSVAVFKPVQTGVEPGEPGDVDFVRAAAGPSPLLAEGCAYRLRAPLAPAVAARLEGVVIDPQVLRRRYAALSAGADVALVEGAGGLLVPLAEGYATADLARDLGLAALIVARPSLGTLNHTALTVEAARARGLRVAGVVLSGFPGDPGLAERTNPREIVGLTGAELWGVLPAITGLDTERLQPRDLSARARAGLAPALGGTFDPDTWMRTLERGALARGVTGL